MPLYRRLKLSHIRRGPWAAWSMREVIASRFIGRRVELAVALLLLSATGVAAGAQPEVEPAKAAFEQARSLCEAGERIR